MTWDKPNREHYFAAIGIFLAAALAGYLFARRDLDQAELLVRQSLSGFSFLTTAPAYLIFLFIFFNNAIKVLVIMVLGLAFGLIPFYFLASNGWLVGVVIALAQAKSDITVAIFGLLPHGILELSAVMIGASYGIWLGHRTWRRIREKEPFGEVLPKASLVYVRIILPLLLAAALIETYITPLVISAFRN